MSFHVTNLQIEFGPNWRQIPWLFYVIYPGFICFSFIHAGTWHGFWTSSSHGISMAFVKKMMGFPSDFVSFSTKLMAKRHGKIHVTFFTGITSKFRFVSSLNNQCVIIYFFQYIISNDWYDEWMLFFYRMNLRNRIFS